MRYFRGLIISLSLHLSLLLVLALIPKTPANFRLNSRPAYVELLEQPELQRRPRQQPRDTKQIVRSVEVPEEAITKEKKPTQFASEEERFVFEEQRARLTDMSKNRGGSILPPATGPKRQEGKETGKHRQHAKNKMDFTPESALERAQKEISEGHQEGDVRIGGMQGTDSSGKTGNESPLIRNMVGAEPGLSAFGEAVPDTIKFGDFTALNTDRHLYYSFYSRMEEKIRNRWVSYARAAIYNTPGGFQARSGKDVWVTKLEVILDSEGRFVKAILTESSGSRSLDAAPVQAFRDAHQFPNPPPEMIKDDGQIHIAYAFSVNIVPSRYADGE